MKSLLFLFLLLFSAFFPSFSCECFRPGAVETGGVSPPLPVQPTDPALRCSAACRSPHQPPVPLSPLSSSASLFTPLRLRCAIKKPGEVSLNVTTFTRSFVRRSPGRVPGDALMRSALRNSHKVHHSREAGGEVGSSKRLIHFHTAAVRALISLCEPKLRQQAAAARPDTLIKNGC